MITFAPQILLFEPRPQTDVQRLVRRLECENVLGDVEVTSSLDETRNRFETTPPALLILSVGDSDGVWRSIAESARSTETDFVVLDPDHLVAPEAALEAGAADYVGSFDDRQVDVCVNRLVEWATRASHSGSELPPDVGIAALAEVSDLVYLFDEHGRLRWWNQELEDVTGRTHSELEGMDPTGFFRGDDRDRITDAFRRAVDGESVTVEAEFVTASGDARPYEFTGELLEQPHWGGSYVCGVGRDVSERVEREAVLRATKRQMDAIFQDPMTFVGVLDTDGRLLEANQTALKYIDTSLEEIEGDSFWNLPWWAHSPEGRATVKAAIASAKNGETTWFETEHHRSDGYIGMFDVVVRPVTDEHDDVVTILAVAVEVTEREALRSRLDEILGRINDAVFALDTDWRFTYVNERALELTYSSQADILDRVFWEVFPEALGTEYERQFRRAMETQETTTFEAYYDPVDMWTVMRVYPSETGLSVYYRDVTESHRNKQDVKLMASVTRLAAEATSFDEALGEVLETVCTQTEFVYGEAWVPEDDTLSSLATYSVESLPAAFVEETKTMDFARGVGLPGRVWAANAVEWLRDASEATESEFLRQQYLEGSIKSAIGVPVAVEDEVVAVLTFFLPHRQDATSQVDSLSAIASGVGTVLARQRTRDELERERSLLNRVFQTSPVGIVLADAAGNIVRSNEQFKEILGHEEAEVTDRTYFDEEWELTDAARNRIPANELPVGRVLETGESVFGYEHSVLRSDGVCVWIRVNAEPLLDENGDVEYAIATVQDITQERNRKRELALQGEQLSVMDRILRHDIRTHSNVIRGYTDLLDQGEVSVSEATARIGKHVDDLLSTAEKTRLATRYIEEAEPSQRTVEQVLIESTAALEDRGRQYDLSVTVDFDVQRRLQSTAGLVLALTELLENAALYGDESSPTELRVERTDAERDEVNIRIVDYGPGIPEFELDVLESNREEPLSHSNGIGIWLARWLIEAHDGTLDIDVLDGGGTVCSITLPTVDGE